MELLVLQIVLLLQAVAADSVGKTVSLEDIYSYL